MIDLYFTGNQVADHLYLNQGNMKFKEVSLEAGIDNASGWTTGVSFVDINNDGLLDIYVCKIGEYKGIKGANKLYVNQGVEASGLPRFKDEAEGYNLNIKSFSTQAAFFDYDIDGDLDMFLLNHSVNPNRTYGKGKLRMKPDSLAGDRLMRNDSGKFVDVSSEAGIFQGKIGYGLGLGVSDLNNDGYPDIYVGNDFFENDYLYMNLGDGKYKEVITEDETNLGHTTHSSMGNDLADYNNDGWIDIISMDMLPEELAAYKTSGQEHNNQIYNQYLKNGFRPQYMQNALHLNTGGLIFKETAHAAGIAATDWSWSPLFADLDNDGFKDVFITNGILGATNDMDFINFIANDKIQSRINQGMKEKDMEFTKDLPERKLPNYLFKNMGNLRFENTTALWFNEIPSFSNGSSYADLDNDGDLDLIVNNVNSTAYIIENRTNSSLPENKYLKISFDGASKNKSGIGAKVQVYVDSLILTYENFLSRGYMSSVPPTFTMGIGPKETIDSVMINWPDGNIQIQKSLKTGQHIVFKHKDSKKPAGTKSLTSNALIAIEKDSEWKHHEPASYEFGREPLIPYSKGYDGPDVAVADINGDGLDDVYLCGGKNQAGILMIQGASGSWMKALQPEFEQRAESEETVSHFFDADGDGDMDLITASGGNEAKNGSRLNPALYINQNGHFTFDINFPKIELNASDIVSADFDLDGDLDLILSSGAVPQQFARAPKQYVLFNMGQGRFDDVSNEFGAELEDIGLVDDLEALDLNGDNLTDLIVAGHWSPITILMNNGKKLVQQKNNGLENSNGLWNVIKAADLDQDGDLDLIAGNWGLNTRLKASAKEPLTVYLKDFDNNGKEEAIMTFYHEGIETVFSSKDDLSKQLSSLNKKFLSYGAFAQASVTDLFGENNLKEADKKEVYTLEHSYFINKGDNSFVQKALPFEAQTSSVKILYLHDFDRDGFTDLFLAGNDYDISTQLGRLDASHGEVLINTGKGSFYESKKIKPLIRGKARAVKAIDIGGEKHLIISRNNNVPILINLNYHE